MMTLFAYLSKTFYLCLTNNYKHFNLNNMNPLTIIGYIAYIFFAIMIIGSIPNFFFRFIALCLFVAPILRKLFMPKTVYDKYGKLLSLFKQTHRSFQITKNEPEVVEFTLKGFEKDSLQYGSIEYNINAPIIDSGNFTINSKPRVYVSLHTTFKGIDISIEKNFYHSYDQTMMYDEIMIPYMKKVMEIVNNFLNEEDEDNDENQESLISKPSEQTDSLPQEEKKSKPIIIKTWSLLSFAREFGKMQVGEFINSETKEHYKACIFTKDNNKTFVAFSSKLGVLTPKEIVERKNSLIVVQLDSGMYSLCENPANN